MAAIQGIHLNGSIKGNFSIQIRLLDVIEFNTGDHIAAPAVYLLCNFLIVQANMLFQHLHRLGLGNFPSLIPLTNLCSYLPDYSVPLVSVIDHIIQSGIEVTIVSHSIEHFTVPGVILLLRGPSLYQEIGIVLRIGQPLLHQFGNSFLLRKVTTQKCVLDLRISAGFIPANRRKLHVRVHLPKGFVPDWLYHIVVACYNLTGKTCKTKATYITNHLQAPVDKSI